MGRVNYCIKMRGKKIELRLDKQLRMGNFAARRVECTEMQKTERINQEIITVPYISHPHRLQGT